MANHQYACSDCGHRQDDLCNCTKCGEGPLLDLASSGTAEMLIEQDRQRAERSRSRALWISLPIGMAVGGLFAGVLPQVLALIPLPIPFALPIKVIVLMVLVTLAFMQAIVRLLPPKQWWQDLEPESKSTRDMTAAMRGMPTKSTAIKAALFIGAGALVVGLGTVATTYGELTELGEQKTAQAAYAKLSTCLLGRDASVVGVEDRLRGIELQLEANPQANGWPERCNDHAKSMYDAVEGVKEFAALRSILGAKLGCAKQCDLAGSRVQLGPMLAAAQQAGLQPEDAPEVEPPPTLEGALMSADRFATLADKSNRLLDYAWLENDRLVALMHEPGRAMMLCDASFASGAKDASCFSLFDAHSPVAPSSAKLLRDGAEPIVYGVTKASVKGTDDGGRNPLTGRSSMRGFGAGRPMGGAKVEKPEPKRVEVERGAFRSDGSPAEVFLGEQEAMANGIIVEAKKDGHRVTRIVDGGAKGGFDIKAKDVVAGPWAEGDYVAWVARKDEGSVLMQQKVGVSGAKEGKSTNVGSVASASSPKFCKARGVHVAVLGHDEEASMTFLSEEGWSVPVRAQGTDDVGKKKAAPPPRPSKVASPPAASERLAGGSRYGVKGPKDSPDPHIARSAALRDAAEFGMLGLLNSGKGGEPAPWGRDDSIGSALGSGSLGLGSSTAKSPRRGVADPPAVTCGDGAATVTLHSVAGRSVIVTQLRCTPEGCTRKRTRVEDVPVKSMWMVTALDGAVMMLWRSPLGALRVRTGPIEELSTKADSIIFDSPDFGGPKTGSRQFFTDGKTALVLFINEGLHGLWLASDGSFGAVGEG